MKTSTNFVFRSRSPMRGIRIAVMVFSVAVLLSSCLVNQQDLWESDKLPPSSPLTRSPSSVDIAYGLDPLQKLDLYLPSSAVQGTILWFHSGGWCCGDKAEIDPLILSTIDRGYAVVSANYRLAPQSTAEEQLADVDRAVRFVKASKNSWDTGSGKVIVAGGSAGGTLALLAAAAPRVFAGDDLGPLAVVDPVVDAAISLVGPSDLRTYINGTIGGWGTALAEVYLGCSDLGSALPTMNPTLTTDDSSQTALLMPPCDPLRVLKFSPMFWAALTVFFGGTQLPPVYLAYGDQDLLVPPMSQGQPLHDWWAAGGNWLATYYDNPTNGTHNLSFDVNATAFYLWLKTFAAA